MANEQENLTESSNLVPIGEASKIIKLVNLGEDSFAIVRLPEPLPDNTTVTSISIMVKRIPLGGGGGDDGCIGKLEICMPKFVFPEVLEE